MTLGDGFPAVSGTVDSTELRKALAGLILRDTSGNARAGVFPRHTSALVTSKASMAVDVAAFEGITVRGGGPIFMANDGTVAVTIEAAPVSNSRIDVVYFKQNESASPYSDANNSPVIEVSKGTAGAIPVKPSIPSGATELATVLIPSGVSATNAGGVVITQTYPYTALTGTALWVRNSTERGALGTYTTGARVLQLDTMVTYRYDGSAWKAWDSDWITYTSTPSNLTVGSGGSISAKYRWIAGQVEHDIVVLLGSSPTVGVASLTTGVTLANPSATTSRFYQGESMLLEEGTGNTPAVLLVNTAGTLFLIRYWGTLNSSTPLGSTAPFTWGAGDRMLIKFTAAAA